MSETVDEEYSVLVVCTGNICRSPALERVLRGELPSDSGITVSSAGTDAVVDAPISDPMAQLLRASMYSTGDFAARRLSADLIREADLVIGFTREHRSAVVTLHPPALRHTFTFLELTQMLDAVHPRDVDEAADPLTTPAARLAAALPLATRHRVLPGHGDTGDVEDPFGKEVEVYRRVYDQIHERTKSILRAILR